MKRIEIEVKAFDKTVGRAYTTLDGSNSADVVAKISSFTAGVVSLSQEVTIITADSTTEPSPLAQSAKTAIAHCNNLTTGNPAKFVFDVADEQYLIPGNTYDKDNPVVAAVVDVVENDFTNEAGDRFEFRFMEIGFA